jgi:hypothetical protein
LQLFTDYPRGEYEGGPEKDFVSQVVVERDETTRNPPEEEALTIWRSTLAQTAVTVAAERAESDEDFERIRDEVFAYLESKAVEDDAAYEATKSEKPERSSSSSKGSSKRSGKTGGGKKGKGDGHFHGDLDDALKMELKFGAFEGVSLGELLEIDVDEAEADYDYGDGERDGRDYIRWLASDRNKGEYSREAAALVAEANGIEGYDD